MQVIFYGAGAYLAQNIKRLSIGGYHPVCVCDVNPSKWYKPFCGRKDLTVLPLNEARDRYPDCKIYVTVDHRTMGAVLHYLTCELNIQEQNIVNWAPIEYRLGCSDLETTIKFHSKRMFVRCYWRRPGIDRSGNMAEDIQEFNIWRDQMMRDIRDGNETPCDGCENLKQGWYLKEQTLAALQISESDEYSFCNFNCCYCFTKAKNRNLDSTKLKDTDEQLEALRYISESIDNKELELQFSTGEITVHPNREAFLKLFQKYQTMLFTNASIYNAQIAGLMEQGLLTIVVSMDCGTTETFHKIKGVNCYQKVCDNLKQYAATGGCIILKYINLTGVNDNDQDIAGFLDLAAQLGAVVQLSNDTRTRCAALSPASLNAVQKLAAGALQRNLLVVHEKEVFSDKDNQLIAAVLRGDCYKE